MHKSKNGLSKSIPTHYVPACHIVSSTPCLIHPLFSSTTWFFSAFYVHIRTCLGASFKLALVFCKKERSGETIDWPFILHTFNCMQQVRLGEFSLHKMKIAFMGIYCLHSARLTQPSLDLWWSVYSSSTSFFLGFLYQLPI